MTSTDHTCTVPQIADGQRWTCPICRRVWRFDLTYKSLGQMTPGRRAPRRRPR